MPPRCPPGLTFLAPPEDVFRIWRLCAGTLRGGARQSQGRWHLPWDPLSHSSPSMLLPASPVTAWSIGCLATGRRFCNRYYYDSGYIYIMILFDYCTWYYYDGTNKNFALMKSSYFLWVWIWNLGQKSLAKSPAKSKILAGAGEGPGVPISAGAGDPVDPC